MFRCSDLLGTEKVSSKEGQRHRQRSGQGVSQAGGELKDHWAHFQSIFLRRLCLSKIGQLLINAPTGKEGLVPKLPVIRLTQETSADVV